MMAARWMAGMAVACTSIAAMAQAPKTAQALFDEAQAAYERYDWPAAEAGFAEAMRKMRRDGPAAAAVRVRHATALFQLNRQDEARRDVTEALRLFAAAGTKTDTDLSAAHQLMGALLKEAGEPIASADHFASADAAATTTAEAVSARFQRAQILMTVQPATAAQIATGIIDDPALFATLSKQDRALVWSLRARAELNRGDMAAARATSTKAIGFSGGLDDRVSVVETQIRADAALIAAKSGNAENARKYLAFAGAGRLPSYDWLDGGTKDLPICGGDIAPQDVAVVDFGILPSGHTVNATAVYASKPGLLGTAFAQSVAGWRWSPAAVAKLNPFWRASIRVELRCQKRPTPIDMADSFIDETMTWLDQHGVRADIRDVTTVVPVSTDPAVERYAAVARDLVALRQPNAKRETATRLTTMLATLDAPAGARAYAIRQTGDARLGPDMTRANFERLPGGSAAVAWLLTEAAIGQERRRNFDTARQMLAEVIAMTPAQLPEEHPVRTVALLHAALLARQQGAAANDPALAQVAGLNADQCSLLDVRPVMRNMPLSSSDFPMEAMAWGFEGAVRQAFDITADGRVEEVRTVIAYPPFVFGPSTEKALAKMRYAPPTLGDQAVGCVGKHLNINYRMN